MRVTMVDPHGNRVAMALRRLGTHGASSSAAEHVADGVGVGLLAVPAARAVSTAPRATAWLVALDVIVGLAFIASAVVSPGPRAERRWIGAVGAAWLLGRSCP